MSSSYLHGLVKLFPLPEKRNDFFCVYITSIAMALLSTFVFYKFQSFELMAFPDRIHGGGIFDGHDAFKRPSFYFSLLGYFFVIFSGSISFLSIILKQFAEKYQTDVILFEKHTLISVSSILIISIPMVLINEPLYEIQYDLFKGLTLGVFLILVLRWLLCINNRHTLLERIRLTTPAFGFFFLFAGLYLSSKALRYPLDSFIDTRMGYLHNILFIFLLGWIASILDRKHCFLKVCVPLLFVPLSFIITSETQYMLLTHGYEVSLRSLLLYSTTILCTISVFLFLTTKKDASINHTKLMKYWYFPLCVVTLSIFTLWQPSMFIDDDLLHPANSLVPAQQLLQFGKIPFIDFWVTRGLRDSLPSTLFMLFAGEQHAINSFIWFQLISQLTYLFILYFTFTKLVRPVYAFFLTFFFSQIVCEHSGWYNSLMLLPLLFLPWTMRNITFIRAACIWFLAAIVFVWMPSAGKATILGLCLVFFIKGLQDIKVVVCKVLPVFFTVFGGLGLIFIALTLFKDGNIFDRIIEIYSVTCLEHGAHAYNSIVSQPSLNVIWYYIVTPLFFAGICWLFIWRSISSQPIPATHWMYLGMAASMVFFFTRSFGRHCLIEKNYLMVFTFILIGLLPLIRPFKQRIYLPAWLFVPAIIIMFSYKNFVFIPSEALKIPLVSWNNDTIERINYTDNYKPIIAFLQQQLKGKETFIELINGHGLYVYTNKRNPFYLQNISLYATDNAQKVLVKHLQKEFDEGNIPLAIVNSPFWGGCIDGMASTANHYRVAEFIYTHYLPYKNILGFEVWAAKGSRFIQEGSPEQTQPVEVEIPIISQGKYYGGNANITFNNNMLNINYGPYLPMVAPSIVNMMTATKMEGIDLTPYKVCTCVLELTNVVPGWLQVFFSFDNQLYTEKNSCKILIPNTKKTTVTLKKVLPNTVKKLTDIKLRLPDYTFADIFSFKLQLSKEYPITPLNIVQFHTIKCGAHLWANYDPYHAIQNNLLTTLLTNVTLMPNEAYPVSISPYTHTNVAEYLLFRITSPAGGEIEGIIKDTNNHSGTFFFTLKKSTEPIDYLVRVSSQYAWKDKKTFSLISHSKEAIHIEYVNVLEGD